MLAGTGVIFAAVYLLWMVQRVFFGKVTNAKNKNLNDLSWREIGLIAPLALSDGLYGRLSATVFERSKDCGRRNSGKSNGKPGGRRIDKGEALRNWSINVKKFSYTFLIFVLPVTATVQYGADFLRHDRCENFP